MIDQDSPNTGQAPGSPDLPSKIIILGAGRFGRLAAERLIPILPGAEFLVVDSDREKLDRVSSGFNMAVVEKDAMAYICESTLEDHEWIVPAVPLHVTFEWMLRSVSGTGGALRLPVPESADTQVPNPLRSPDGTLYASFATFLCPDYCSEPGAVCTHTKQARPGNLFERLGQINVPGYRVVVTRSFQLAPGVGGYPVKLLREKLREVISSKGRWIVATACRCHGVLNALQLEA